jgi:hypothetical protein
MGYCMFKNFNFLLTLCLLFGSFMVFPDMYSVLTLSASKKWRSFKSKIIPKRKVGKNLKRYWEIDVKKLRE